MTAVFFVHMVRLNARLSRLEPRNAAKHAQILSGLHRIRPFIKRNHLQDKEAIADIHWLVTRARLANEVATLESIRLCRIINNVHLC